MQDKLIFLIGPPRSGSTLLMRMVSTHSQIYSRPEPHLMTPLAHMGVYDNVDKAPYDQLQSAQSIAEFIRDLPGGEADYLDAVRAFSDVMYGRMLKTLPGGGTSDYAPLMYYEALRVGHYEAFCRPDATIPLMYMPDALRALVELSQAPRERLSRSVYNVAAFSPTAREIADEVMRAVPGADITFKPDPARQAILDSWPKALDDSLARRDWGWAPRHDLQAMTADLLPKLRELLPPGAA